LPEVAGVGVAGQLLIICLLLRLISAPGWVLRYAGVIAAGDSAVIAPVLRGIDRVDLMFKIVYIVMKGERIKYPKVEKLPESAMIVSKYADNQKITIAGVYKRYKTQKIRIVDFQGVNFVLNE
jgi:predicted transcriptional regulator with HTH domain